MNNKTRKHIFLIFLIATLVAVLGTLSAIGNSSRAASVSSAWTYCSNEYSLCSFTGTRTVRYGINGIYVQKTVTDSTRCINEVFGDPVVGIDKICEYDAESGTPPPIWVHCADEGSACSFSGTRDVRYGANGSYFYKMAKDSIPCSNAVFGESNHGSDKTCEYDSRSRTPPPTAWIHCAIEDSRCAFSGTRVVRYGAEGKYFYKTGTNSIACSNAVFGAPIGDANKTCDHAAQPTPSVWSPLVSFPIIPVAAANLPNGKVLTWSANSPTSFSDDDTGQTYVSIFDPATQASSTQIVSQTGHDMFCPGTSLLADGRLLVSGGTSSSKTSIYDFNTSSWTTAAAMNIPRGYQGNVTLSNGAVLALGGSWSGPMGGKHGEIWTQGAGWRRMSGIPVNPFIGPDPSGVYRGDNHLWLFAQANGKVFHAGPAANMNWIDTTGNGQVTPAGNRGDAVHSMNGNAVMYDIGKILAIGGAPAYDHVASSAASYLIDIGAGAAQTRKIAAMSYPRAMHNSVVLPNGQVVIVGGQTFVKIWSDDLSVLMAEIWDPKTERFTELSPMAVPRNYHSVALLLTDGRVMVGGGGLCNFDCSVNHPDAQILTPPYLLNADGSNAARPTIASAPLVGTYGSTLAVTTGSAISEFALMRLASVTHSVNTDQRRVPLQFSATDATHYSLSIPSSRGIVPPGYYMLFAMNKNGVPSLSRTIRIQ